MNPDCPPKPSPAHPRVGTDLAQSGPNLDVARVLALSVQQAELLHAVAQGWSDDAIAERGNTTAVLIRQRVHRIVRKLDAAHRAHAVAIAYDAGLFTSRVAPEAPQPTVLPAHTCMPTRILSSIEQMLVQHLADGDTYGEIGRRYALSEATVTELVRQIRRHCKARNVTHLVSILHRYRLIR